MLTRRILKMLFMICCLDGGIANSEETGQSGCCVVTTNYLCDSDAQILYLGDDEAIPNIVNKQFLEVVSVTYASPSGMDLVPRPDLDYVATPVTRTCNLRSGRYQVSISAGHVRYDEGPIFTVQPTVSIKKGAHYLLRYATLGDRIYQEKKDGKGCSVGWAISFTLNGRSGKLFCER